MTYDFEMAIAEFQLLYSIALMVIEIIKILLYHLHKKRPQSN